VAPVFSALLIKKLQSIGTLSKEDEQELRNLSGASRELAPGEAVVHEGDQPNSTTLVQSGVLCRYKHVAEGKRQIMSFHIAGDIPDLQSLFMQSMDHSLGAVVRSHVVLIRHEVVRNLLKRCPGIGFLFWRDTLIDASVFREWMTSIGRRDAQSRIAHLFCEMVTRMRAVGLADTHHCDLPITQLDVADALGLTDIHVCRVLKNLREQNIVEFRHGVITVLDWEGLQEAGEFDPAYLHLKTERVA